MSDSLRVADYIVQRLVEHGITHVFTITGGGAMYLNDAFGKNKNIMCIYNHHEQACAIAAEGYFRSTGKICAVCITTGPAGLNTLTGIMGQWTDSIPVIYISGQVNTNLMISSYNNKLRQLGDQECNITEIVRSLTKSAVILKNPTYCKSVIDNAIATATSPRMGPVWIDIPLDIQKQVIDSSELTEIKEVVTPVNVDSKSIKYVTSAILKSKKPLIIAGHGIRLSNSLELFNSFISNAKIPIATTFNGFDLVQEDNPLYIGRIGTIGQRGANFSLQNADLVLFLGTRNNLRQIGYNWNTFAKKATKIVADVDEYELNKPTVKPDIGIRMDINLFLKELLKEHIKFESNDWLNWCKKLYNKYPVMLPEYDKCFPLNPYKFSRILSEEAKDSIIICGNGSACVCMFQAGVVKNNNRFFWNAGCASMGYDLPAAIGASIANPDKHVICITGDGSIMMNLQELQTIKNYKLPIKIFILDNSGYHSIRQTQKAYFGEEIFGCDKYSGVELPNFRDIATAFKIDSWIINSPERLNSSINDVLSCSGPIICKVTIPNDYSFSPKLAPRIKDGIMVPSSIEDMCPFLSEKEMKENIYE